jgi:hypothetical protein
MQRESIGKGTSINGIGLIIGEVLSMGVLFRLTANMSNKMAFSVATVVVMLLTLAVTTMVTEPEDLVKAKHVTQINESETELNTTIISSEV